MPIMTRLSKIVLRSSKKRWDFLERTKKYALKNGLLRDYPLL